MVESHVQDKSKHKVAIYFYSEPMTWIGSIGNQMLLATGDKLTVIHQGEMVETETLTMPFV
jgi:hypothetical protein